MPNTHDPWTRTCASCVRRDALARDIEERNPLPAPGACIGNVPYRPRPVEEALWKLYIANEDCAMEELDAILDAAAYNL